MEVDASRCRFIPASQNFFRFFYVKQTNRPHKTLGNRGFDNGTRLDQTGQFTRVIDMQVRQQHDVGFGYKQLCLAKARERTRTRIDHDPRHAIDQHQIAGTSAPGCFRARYQARSASALPAAPVFTP